VTASDSTPIGPYGHAALACREYDPAFPAVAERVATLIASKVADVLTEHIGSTSVPGCRGKGIIDLAVLYPPGRLEAAKQALAVLGFQRQTTRDPFLEDRPMRTGSLDFAGRIYRLHAHVIALGSTEDAELRAFRDRLRADPQLIDAYVARKREIIAAGVTDSVDYCIAKGGFVQDCLAAILNSPCAESEAGSGSQRSSG
jgi:GrpB-like predicted nucleotidyltransferase (UPF0157 family)